MITKTKKHVVFDLDDTLYNEINFLKSAFSEISKIIATDANAIDVDVYNDLMSFFYKKDNSFEMIIKKYNSSLSINQLINFYRNHKPNISMTNTNKRVLKTLKNNNINLGLLTDGRSLQQRNKIESLGLKSYFSEIIISEEFGTEKPNINNFKYFENTFGSAEYYYIGDNLKKDFITPNNLNWTTICLLDNGLNIHSQDFKLSKAYLPKFTVKSLDEILKIIQLPI